MGKKTIVLGAVLGLAAGAAGALWALYYALFRRPLASTSGVIELDGLHCDADVFRDRWGVPHICAEDTHDLFFAQGFVHAQDRFFQMEFWRRTGAGRLAEVLGPPAVEVDRWMRILGLRRVAEKEVALLDAEIRELLQAYANGVNAFIDRGKLPLEFTLLRYAPERWQIADSLTWVKMMDWTLAVNWEAELLRAQLMAKLGPELTASLDAPYPQQHPTTLPPGIDWSHIGAGAMSRADAARPYTGPPTEAGLGSNNWVIGGAHSASGAPLLASDMHLPLGMPSIWYENHLCGDGYDVMGLSFVGVPGIIAGHNGCVAWSLTAGFPDTQDLYVERLNPHNPHQFEFEGTWHDAEVLREEIAVKGGESIVQDVIITHHGPLIDGLVPEESSEPLALRWTASEPSDMISLICDFGRVQNCSEFHETLRRWTGPVVNIVYADVEGNIGYTLAGRMPIRAAGHDGSVPVPGWTGEYEWLGYVPFEHWPHAINPPEGILVTANAKPVTDEYPYYLGRAWLPGFRAARINELLTSSQKLTIADCCQMQFDQISVLARHVGQYLSDLDTHTVATLFKDWDGDLSADSAAAAVYEVFIRRFLYNLFDTLAGDALENPNLADRFVGKGPHPVLVANSIYSGPNGRALLARLLDTPDSRLFRERSRDELMQQSLREAVEFLEWKLGPQVENWRWGDLHQLTFIHPLGQVKPLDRLFNRGPYAVGGDETTIWNTSIYYHSLDSDQIMVGPACRFVVDLGDLDRSRSLNAPGQSGQPGSRHYADRIQAWLDGDYHPMLYNRQDVIAQAETTLHLLANAQEGNNGWSK
jgi:penicillin amidase